MLTIFHLGPVLRLSKYMYVEMFVDSQQHFDCLHGAVLPTENN